MSALSIVLMVLVIVAGVLVLLVAIFVPILIVIRTRGRRVEGEMRRRYGESILLIDRLARSFGVESQGLAQIRGNGCLVATPEVLAFSMWVPRRDLVIRRADIESVEIARTHLGKVGAVLPLVKVRFRNSAGGTDSIAWQLREPERWVEVLSP